MSLNIQSMFKLWNRSKNFPGGKHFVSKAIGFAVPYTGTLGAWVAEVRPGHVEVVLPDRRKVRNYLNSVHAMALANVGEFASGLSLHTLLNSEQRAILVSFKIEFLKKARGELRAISDSKLSKSDPKASFEEWIQADIQNKQGEVVARVHAQWKVGPAQSSSRKLEKKS